MLQTLKQPPKLKEGLLKQETKQSLAISTKSKTGAVGLKNKELLPLGSEKLHTPILKQAGPMSMFVRKLKFASSPSAEMSKR